MKTFEGTTYYDILNVPVNAAYGDIKRAYREALAIYEEDSLVTYSLFSKAQRESILMTLEEAYYTLTDEQKRAAYNQTLVDNGEIDAAAFSSQAQKEMSTASQTRKVSKEDELHAWIKKKSSEEETQNTIRDVMAKDWVSGDDLKRLRKTFGITISEIYDITKISKSNLKAIEADHFEALPSGIYLKFYLRSYAEILQIDPQRVVDGYLKYMSLDTGET